MILFNNFCYNVSVAKKFGVNSSVFLSCLSEVHRNNDKTCEYFLLSRQDIFERTGLSFATQEKIEEFLSNSQVINIKNFKTNADKHYYHINYEKIDVAVENTIKSQDILTVKTATTNNASSTKKETKQERHINSLKKGIASFEMSSMLQQMFCEWVDAVYANPKGFLTLPSIRISYQDLSNYTQDEEVRQKIMRIAIKNGYRDMQWAIQMYDKSTSNNSSFNWKNYDSMVSDGSQIVNEEF